MTYDPNAPSPYGQPAGAAPYGQPSASAAPYGQPSASAPYGQPSAAAPYGQPSAAAPYGNEVTQQLPMQPQQEYTGGIPQGAYGPEQTGPMTMQAQGGTPVSGPAGGGPLAFLSDLNFRQIHAPKIAKLAFILVSAGLLINWLAGVVSLLMLAIAAGDNKYANPTNTWLTFGGHLLLGWVVPVGTIMLLRIGLEWAVNSLRKLGEDRAKTE